MVGNHIRHSLWLCWLATAIAGRGAEVGSAACAPCHAAIAQSYAATGMARSAGRAVPVALPARVGAYSVTASGPGGIRLGLPGGATAGERRLDWFVGSGHAGRSYLFGVDGFLFQAPVSYFAASKTWMLSPGFENLRGGQLTRAVEPSCLQCHASRLQHREGSVNGFADPPFLEGGVSCERCHGEGDRHAANPQAARMVNPARLTPDRRDSICEQCHLTGAARVARADAAGRPHYRPGDRLADSLAVFIWKDRAASTGATGHTEGLAQSGCAQKSPAGRLSCLSCHDPHAEPAPAAKAAFYRARCERCHAAGQTACHRQGRTDCISCHMPRRATPTTDHLAFTDHSIPRVARLKAAAAAAPASPSELVSFWRDDAVAPRDLALAYAIAAGSRPAALAKAGKLLAGLEGLPEPASGDAPLLLELAQWHERQGRPERARSLYERALKIDPAATAAAVNLGNLLMKAGDADGAMELWRDALTRNPGLTAARLNLGMAEHRAGRRDAAIATLRTALAFEPRLEPARRLLTEMGAATTAPATR